MRYLLISSAVMKECKKPSWLPLLTSLKQVFDICYHHYRSLLNNNYCHQNYCRLRNHLITLYSQCYGLVAFYHTIFYRWYILLLIIIGLANHYTGFLLLKAKNLSKHSTYNSIAYHLYSSKISTFFLSFLNLFGNVGFGKYF